MMRAVQTAIQWGIFGCLAAWLLVPATEAREWTDKQGRSIEAEYVSAADGKVQLRSAKDGKTYTIPIETLSDADQLMIGDDRFSQSIRENPDSAEAYLRRALVKNNRKEYERAMVDFNRAIQLDARNADAHDGRGVAYAALGDPVKAHADFDRAIEFDPKLASAYRHRGENYKALAKTREGATMVDAKVESYRKSHQAARQEQLRDKGWQPLNSTTGNITRYAAISQLAKVDLEMAEEIEQGYYGKWGVGVGGGAGYGVGIGVGKGVGAGVKVVGPGYPVKVEGDPALAVYPEKVKQGEIITLVANPAELAKVMPAKPGEGKSAYGKKGEKMKVASVDFYRDVDGDGELNTETDQYLATDDNGEDGFTAEVSTAKLPPGKQNFFAQPGADETTGLSEEELASLIGMLEKAAADEQGVAQENSAAAEGAGLSGEQVASMGKTQESVMETAKDAYGQLQDLLPEAADAVKQAGTPARAAGNLLKQAGTKPGEASKEKAASAAEKATQAAEKFAAAADMLKKVSEDGPPVAQGAPVAGQGEIVPNPDQIAAGPGPGKPGKGSPGGDGPGKGGDGNYSDDDDDADIHHHYYGDDDDDDLVLVDDEDYDRVIEDYDRVLVDQPDNVIYRGKRASVYLDRGGYDYAIRDYNVVLNSPEVELTLEQRIDFYYNRGCAHLSSGNLAGAIADFDTCIGLDELGRLRYMAYNNRGIALAKQGELEKALADFNAAIGVNADDALAYKNRALAYKKLGKAEQAEQDQAKANDLSSL